MNPTTWQRVDAYLATCFLAADEQFEFALQASAAAALPAIQVTPLQGKLLMLLTRLAAARRVLEIGTLGGYSTLWLARGLADGGRIITLELEPRHAAVARSNFAHAGVADRIELREGNALSLLGELAAQSPPPFDLVFIDADKPSNPDYMEWAIRLTRAGAVIVVDNVIRDGLVAEPDDADPRVRGVRLMNDRLKDDARVTATTIQTVGEKGYDGLMIAVRN